MAGTVYGKEAVLRTDGLIGGRGETALAAIPALILAGASMRGLLGNVSQAISLPRPAGLAAFYFVIACTIAAAMPAISKRVRPLIVMLVVVALGAFFAAALAADRPLGFRAQILGDLLIGLASLVALSTLRRFSRCRQFLYYSAFPIIAGVVIQMTWSLEGASEEFDYSQYLTYAALPAVIIFMDAAFERSRILNVVLSAAGTTLIVSLGARGPLIAIAVFLIARMVLALSGSRTASGLILGPLALAVFVLASTPRVQEAIIQSAGLWLERMGLSTRVITFVMQGELLKDDARSSVFGVTLDLIGHNPIFGVGMANEREYLWAQMEAHVEGAAAGWYPHNIFLEFWVQYGLLAGSLLGLSLLLAVLGGLQPSSGKLRVRINLIFVAIGLIPLLYSGSYLGWPAFFAMVGLCLTRPQQPEDQTKEDEGTSRSLLLLSLIRPSSR